MREAKKKLILFDIEGTLLIARRTAKIAFDRAFAEQFTIENAWGDTNGQGRCDKLLIHEIAQSRLGRELSNAEYVAFVESYTESFARDIGKDESCITLPGVSEVLQKLCMLPNVALGLQTGNLKAIAQLKLRRVGLERYFCCGGYGSEHTERRDIIASVVAEAESIFGRKFAGRDSIVVGDTPSDIVAGKNVGAFTVAVATGKYSFQELAVHTPDVVLDSLADYDWDRIVS